MLTKRKFLKIMFWLPGVVALIRVIVTFIFFIENPLDLPLRFFQVIPLISLLCANFSYFKLYSDGVPVITLIAPTLLHVVLIYIFTRQIVLIPFFTLIIIDGLYLVIKAVKSNLFPFSIEGEEDEDDFSDVEENTVLG